MKDDFEKTLSNLNPKNMTKAELEELILKVKEDTFKQTIEYLETNGHIELNAGMQISWFEKANYNAQEANDAKDAYWLEIDKKMYPEYYQ